MRRRLLVVPIALALFAVVAAPATAKGPFREGSTTRLALVPDRWWGTVYAPKAPGLPFARATFAMEHRLEGGDDAAGPVYGLHYGTPGRELVVRGEMAASMCTGAIPTVPPPGGRFITVMGCTAQLLDEATAPVIVVEGDNVGLRISGTGLSVSELVTAADSLRPMRHARRVATAFRTTDGAVTCAFAAMREGGIPRLRCARPDGNGVSLQLLRTANARRLRASELVPRGVRLRTLAPGSTWANLWFRCEVGVRRVDCAGTEPGDHGFAMARTWLHTTDCSVSAVGSFRACPAPAASADS
jgi:hypothetical protein